MRWGRHISAAGTNIMLLVGYAIEHRTAETLAMNLTRLDARSITDLKTRLAALPPVMTPAAALMTEEKFFLDWFIRAVKEAKDKEALVNLLGTLAPTSEPDGTSPDPPETAPPILTASART